MSTGNEELLQATPAPRRARTTTALHPSTAAVPTTSADSFVSQIVGMGKQSFLSSPAYVQAQRDAAAADIATVLESSMAADRLKHNVSSATGGVAAIPFGLSSGGATSIVVMSSPRNGGAKTNPSVSPGFGSDSGYLSSAGGAGPPSRALITTQPEQQHHRPTVTQMKEASTSRGGPDHIQSSLAEAVPPGSPNSIQVTDAQRRQMQYDRVLDLIGKTNYPSLRELWLGTELPTDVCRSVELTVPANLFQATEERARSLQAEIVSLRSELTKVTKRASALMIDVNVAKDQGAADAVKAKALEHHVARVREELNRQMASNNELSRQLDEQRSLAADAEEKCLALQAENKSMHEEVVALQSAAISSKQNLQQQVDFQARFAPAATTSFRNGAAGMTSNGLTGASGGPNSTGGGGAQSAASLQTLLNKERDLKMMIRNLERGKTEMYDRFVAARRKSKAIRRFAEYNAASLERQLMAREDMMSSATWNEGSLFLSMTMSNDGSRGVRTDPKAVSGLSPSTKSGAPALPGNSIVGLADDTMSTTAQNVYVALSAQLDRFLCASVAANSHAPQWTPLMKLRDVLGTLLTAHHQTARLLAKTETSVLEQSLTLRDAREKWIRDVLKLKPPPGLMASHNQHPLESGAGESGPGGMPATVLHYVVEATTRAVDDLLTGMEAWFQSVVTDVTTTVTNATKVDEERKWKVILQRDYHRNVEMRHADTVTEPPETADFVAHVIGPNMTEAHIPKQCQTTPEDFQEEAQCETDPAVGFPEWVVKLPYPPEELRAKDGLLYERLPLHLRNLHAWVMNLITMVKTKAKFSSVAITDPGSVFSAMRLNRDPTIAEMYEVVKLDVGLLEAFVSAMTTDQTDRFAALFMMKKKNDAFVMQRLANSVNNSTTAAAGTELENLPMSSSSPRSSTNLPSEAAASGGSTLLSRMSFEERQQLSHFKQTKGGVDLDCRLGALTGGSATNLDDDSSSARRAAAMAESFLLSGMEDGGGGGGNDDDDDADATTGGGRERRDGNNKRPIQTRKRSPPQGTMMLDDNESLFNESQRLTTGLTEEEEELLPRTDDVLDAAAAGSGGGDRRAANGGGASRTKSNPLPSSSSSPPSSPSAKSFRRPAATKGGLVGARPPQPLDAATAAGDVAARRGGRTTSDVPKSLTAGGNKPQSTKDANAATTAEALPAKRGVSKEPTTATRLSVGRKSKKPSAGQGRPVVAVASGKLVTDGEPLAPPTADSAATTSSDPTGEGDSDEDMIEEDEGKDVSIDAPVDPQTSTAAHDENDEGDASACRGMPCKTDSAAEKFTEDHTTRDGTPGVDRNPSGQQQQPRVGAPAPPRRVRSTTTTTSEERRNGSGRRGSRGRGETTTTTTTTADIGVGTAEESALPNGLDAMILLTRPNVSMSDAATQMDIDVRGHDDAASPSSPASSTTLNATSVTERSVSLWSRGRGGGGTRVRSNVAAPAVTSTSLSPPQHPLLAGSPVSAPSASTRVARSPAATALAVFQSLASSGPTSTPPSADAPLFLLPGAASAPPAALTSRSPTPLPISPSHATQAAVSHIKTLLGRRQSPSSDASRQGGERQRASSSSAASEGGRLAPLIARLRNMNATTAPRGHQLLLAPPLLGGTAAPTTEEPFSVLVALRGQSLDHPGGRHGAGEGSVHNESVVMVPSTGGAHRSSTGAVYRRRSSVASSIAHAALPAALGFQPTVDADGKLLDDDDDTADQTAEALSVLPSEVPPAPLNHRGTVAFIAGGAVPPTSSSSAPATAVPRQRPRRDSVVVAADGMPMLVGRRAVIVAEHTTAAPPPPPAVTLSCTTVPPPHQHVVTATMMSSPGDVSHLGTTAPKVNAAPPTFSHLYSQALPERGGDESVPPLPRSIASRLTALTLPSNHESPTTPLTSRQEKAGVSNHLTVASIGAGSRQGHPIAARPVVKAVGRAAPPPASASLPAMGVTNTNAKGRQAPLLSDSHRIQMDIRQKEEGDSRGPTTTSVAASSGANGTSIGMATLEATTSVAGSRTRVQTVTATTRDSSSTELAKPPETVVTGLREVPVPQPPATAMTSRRPAAGAAASPERRMTRNSGEPPPPPALRIWTSSSATTTTTRK